MGLALMQVGMWTFASVGMYQQKGLKALQVSLLLPSCKASSIQFR